MFALTVSQPYASLIASGEKWIENRRWETKYRGLLAIHAGKGGQYLSRAQLATVPTGAVLAVVHLLACVDVRAMKRGQGFPELYEFSLDGRMLTEAVVLNHRYTEGPVAWVLGGVRRLRDPCPARGAQRLWQWEVPDLIEFVTEPTAEIPLLSLQQRYRCLEDGGVCCLQLASGRERRVVKIRPRFALEQQQT